MDDELLTVSEVAHALRVDANTVRRWIVQGALDAVKIPCGTHYTTYRIKRSVLDNILTTFTPAKVA
jgi:excisionase family DNA binding protein